MGAHVGDDVGAVGGVDAAAEAAGEDGGHGGDEPLGGVGPHYPHGVLPLQAEAQESPVVVIGQFVSLLQGGPSGRIVGWVDFDL